jgi:uncharacterized membrane protein
MQLFAAYVTALILFGLIDAAWLGIMANVLYRPTLGDILLTNLRVGPAIAFYLLFPVGIVVFAVTPAIKTGTLSTAAAYGLLFGALAYATYDLTNYATLRNWSLQLTAVDIVYGALTTAAAGTFAAWVVRLVGPWIGTAAG